MPKSPKSAKKKLTKAEKERLKKEEDERKREEEEEARKKAEAEEQERLNKEKAELEETRRLENEERKRRKGQLLELETIWVGIQEKLQKEAAERRVKAKWDRYMKCDGSPDPTILGEINTYMNLWREDTNNDIHCIMDKGKLTMELINELAFLMADTPPEELPEQTAATYRHTMSELQELLQKKLDLGSHGVLLKATELADPETMNLQKVISNDDITLCTWGNLSKNPRVKSFEFETKGFQFELPKILTLTDCAFRVLFTKYDHYSPKCPTYMPRMKKKEDAVVEEKEQEAEEGQKEEGEEGEKEKEETGEEQPPAEKEANEDVMKELEGVKEEEAKPEEAEAPKEEAEAEDEPMEEDYEIKTPEPQEWEEFDGPDDVIDLRASHILGDIFHFNLLALPPQPRTFKNWVIRQVTQPEGLQNLDYQAEAPPAAPAGTDGEEENKPKKEEKPPITVNLKLPKDIYFCEEPQIVRWDSSDNQWHLDGFSDQSYDEDTKILSFKVFHFGVMALVQESHINMPFQSWEVRPRGPNHVLLTVIAAIVEIEIEIKDDKCTVNVTKDKPELEHFKDNWYTPQDLIKKLRNCGVNIFPAEDSHKYVSIQNKNAATEERLYQQIALTASTMAYSWSKWNKENDDRIVVQGCEHLVDEPLQEEDWSLFMITKKRTTKLKMVEFDENFSEDHAEGTEFHADLYHMVMEITTEEGKKRITNSDYHFVDAVYQMLRGTRVITYS